MMPRISFKMGYLFLLAIGLLHITDAVGSRTLVRRVLYRTLDYRDCYILRSGRSANFKFGIGYDAAGRAKNIDRSIPGTREKLLGYWRLFYARYWESKIRKELGNTNFKYKGSGKTEWHKFRGLLFRTRLMQLKARLWSVWLYQQIIYLGLQALLLLALVLFLRAQYPYFF